MEHRWSPVLCVLVVSGVLAASATETTPTSADSSAGAAGPATPAAAPPPTSPPTTESTAGMETTTGLEVPDEDCSDQFEYANNPELLERLKEYDVAKVLEGLGDAPGSTTNVTRLKIEDVPELEVQDVAERPLPDTDNQTYWQYDKRSTDWSTFVLLEHALVRLKGTPLQFLDVRGELWWTPPGLCGALRHARYRRDDRGFSAEVLRAHCTIFRKTRTLSCFGPDSENECAFCISGVSGALIASLVG